MFPMGIQSINSIMKNMVQNELLQDIDKNNANHSVQNTLVKKVKQNQLPKSEIASFIGHTRKQICIPNKAVATKIINSIILILSKIKDHLALFGNMLYHAISQCFVLFFFLVHSLKIITVCQHVFIFFIRSIYFKVSCF